MKYDHTLPGDSSLQPGEARCPGPTPQDLLARDGDNTPEALREENYFFHGDSDIPWSRYTSQVFFDAEIEHMWSKTWQWACREEHIPEIGDYSVYDVGPYSIIVIRDGADSIKAFANSCPHRAMQLCEAGSAGSGKQFIRCPFHGMSWNLDGSLREMTCRWDFPHVDEDNFRLTEVLVDTWAGFVFININLEAEPLHEYLEVLPRHFEDWGLENRFISLHTEKILPGNWKMVQEGFLEAFHVLATHPEGLHTSSWANTQYDIFGKHVTRFLQNLSSGNQQEGRSEAEIFESLGYKPEDLPAGVTARQQHADNLRTSLGAKMNVDLSDVSNSIMLDSIEYHLFPNAFFFPGITIPLIYRFRPLTVDSCIHEILLLQPVPDNGVRPKPASVVKLGVDDSYTTVPGFPLAHVLDQDTDNFKRQLAGVKASLKGAQTLGNYQEVRIRRFHQTLDEFLDQPHLI